MSEPKVKGRRYSWEEWFRQTEFTLKREEDYNGLDHGFAQYVRRAAKRYGYQVEVKVGVGQLYITVHGRIEPKPGIHSNKYRGKR